MVSCDSIVLFLLFNGFNNVKCTKIEEIVCPIRWIGIGLNQLNVIDRGEAFEHQD